MQNVEIFLALLLFSPPLGQPRFSLVRLLFHLGDVVDIGSGHHHSVAENRHVSVFCEGVEPRPKFTLYCAAKKDFSHEARL